MAIYKPVISPVLRFRPSITTRRTPLAINSAIDRPISQSIEARDRDPRRMLQIGAVLATIYVLFLATWFWATRLRARPPGRARA